MKQLLAVLVLSGLVVTACTVATTPEADEEAVVQAATPTTQPTDTPSPEPTDTPLPTPTPGPTDTPVPSDTPEPTATDTPEATATPTDTPIPTATPEPTSTPQPTAIPEPTAAPPSGEAVSINPFCNCQEQVAIGQPVQLTWAWLTVLPGQAADFAGVTHTNVILDGQSLGNLDQYWGDVIEDSDGYAVRWTYPLGVLEPGTHLVELVVSSDAALTDGFDSDEDGQADLFGPGEMFRGWVEIVVGGEAVAPEAPPPAPSGYDIPPGKALFVFVNYTDKDWNVDIIGQPSYFLPVPPNQPGQDHAEVTIAIDPGTYVWKGSSPLGFYIRGPGGNVDFQFSVAEGEVYTASVR